MPVHDWTLVDAGIFHAFHVAWIPELSKALNDGLLPEGYYALPEQHAGRAIADVLTLHASPALSAPPVPPDTGGIAVAEAPPKVRRHEIIESEAAALPRSLAIRHVSAHRLVAILEIVSPGNKDRPESLETFCTKVVTALDSGVHALLVDLFPPGSSDPQGIHGFIRQHLAGSDEPYALPSEEPLTLVSYVAGQRIEAFIEHASVGAELPEAPLFVRPDRYVNVPLPATYRTAFQGLPMFWRDVLEGRG